MDCRFTTDLSLTMTDQIVDFLAGKRWGIGGQDYPDYVRWLEKVHRQLKTEDKRALIALSGGDVIGAIVYQRHALLPDTMEIKNITVRPDQRGRHIASFLLRNAEIEGQHDYAASHVICDAKAENRLMLAFLDNAHYQQLGTFDLYQNGGGEDILLHKAIS